MYTITNLLATSKFNIDNNTKIWFNFKSLRKMSTFSKDETVTGSEDLNGGTFSNRDKTVLGSEDLNGEISHL